MVDLLLFTFEGRADLLAPLGDSAPVPPPAAPVTPPPGDPVPATPPAP
jgi:hypothetical protein